MAARSLLLIAVILLLTAALTVYGPVLKGSGSLLVQDTPTIAAASPTVTTEKSESTLSPFATPVVSFPATVGVPAVASGTPSTWSTYENSLMGVTLHFPPGWIYVEDPDRLSVSFYPPGSDVSIPSPFIAFTLLASLLYDNAASSPIGKSAPAAVTVSGVVGRYYIDTSAAIPFQSSTIELPHHSGTLFITTTIGPDISLRPILDQILLTVILST